MAWCVSEDNSEMHLFLQKQNTLLSCQRTIISRFWLPGTIMLYPDILAWSMFFRIWEKFWIVGTRATLRRILDRCVNCRRRQALAKSQKMADLPRNFNPPAGWPYMSNTVESTIFVRMEWIRNLMRISDSTAFVSMLSNLLRIQSYEWSRFITWSVL